jgi:hypothetical protein
VDSDRESLTQVVDPETIRVVEVLYGTPIYAPDMDGDGSQELLTVTVPTDGDPALVYRLYTFEGGRLRCAWTRSFMQNAAQNPLDFVAGIGDLDQDALPELVLAEPVTGVISLCGLADRES